MIVQSVWLLVFVLNALIIYLTVLLNKGASYRPAGIVIWTFIIIYLPFTNQPLLTGMPAWYLMGSILFLLGIAIGTSSWILFLVTGISPYARSPKKLVTDGPYTFVRHPQYLALVVMFIGISIARGAVFALYLIPVIIVLHGAASMIEEKAVLEKAFPNEYASYRQRTGMLLPRIK
ncbi:MAG: isoprenylcysteine carboxylmethyltransferase family protein [bacterium]